MSPGPVSEMTGRNVDFFLCRSSRVNDRIMTANGVSLDNVEYGTAVAVLRECGENVTLSLRRRLVMPSSAPHTVRVHLTKTRKKDGKHVE